jgi:hypothetical protein
VCLPFELVQQEQLLNFATVALIIAWELMKQKRNARRPQIAGGIEPPIGEASQFGRVV